MQPQLTGDRYIPRQVRMMKWKICKAITIPYCIRQTCSSKEYRSPPKPSKNSALKGSHCVTLCDDKPYAVCFLKKT